MPKTADIMRRVRRLSQMKRAMDARLDAAGGPGRDPKDPHLATLRLMRADVSRRLERLRGAGFRALA
ncbi:hypothetical protein [Amorphus orientalis]|uniref:Uncharacterized protein n=1 Tax=Amorphus orientalis TaxID=649198 RepID=A0AAE4AUJ8_9HYPH|nr:hypothetical protein [Amorphus orientalis]MDQ0317490.1 hypothetical protein [Amorphus orientalis]